MNQADYPICILIVEDTLGLLRLYSHILTQAGYRVEEANSGILAQRRIEELRPDIVLLDRVLPDSDGSEICQWIKTSPHLAQTYVILLSALKITEEDRLGGLEAGADDYIVKPVSKRELLARVQVATRLKTAQLALLASEAKHRTLAENSPDIIMRLDRGGDIIYVNQSVQRLFGVAPEVILQMTHREMGISDEFAEAWYRLCAEVVSTSRQQRLEFDYRTPSGDLRRIDARFVPEFGMDGQVNSILTVLRDFTDHIRSEQAINRLAAVVEQTTDPVVITNPQGMIEFVNEAFQTLTGYANDCLGQSFEQLFGNSDGICCYFRNVVDKQTPWEGATFLRRKDGVVVDVEANIFPTLNEHNAVTSLVAMVRDQTERRRNEREREVILTVASALRKATKRDEVISIILNQIITLLDVAGAALTSVEPLRGETVIEQARGAHTFQVGNQLEPSLYLTDEVLSNGRPYLDNHVTAPLAASVNEAVRPVRAFLGVPMMVRQRGMGVIWVASADPIPEHVVGILLAIADMAANTLHRVALFDELEQYATDLEMRVEERTRELAEANRRLLELDRLKSKFVSNVSHELRTPISNLKLYLSLLQRGKPERRSHYESMLHLSSDRLGQLVEDILNLSRLEIAHYQPRELEPTDLNAVVKQIIALHQPQAENAGLELRFEADQNLPLIYGDFNQLSQLVTNLVVNALHYTPRGHVHIRTVNPNGHNMITFAVEDTGVGIMPDDMPHIFERFYRGNHRQASDIPGTGLGLAIVKEIVDIHHGEIRLQSEPDVGTRVEVKLPVAGPADYLPT